MADIFSTGPTRSGYMSGASGGFLANRPAEQTASDQLAMTLGRALGGIGGEAFQPKKKPSALDQFRLTREQGQADAEAKIAEIAQGATLDDIQAKYTDAMVIAARAGLGLDKVDQLFQGVALARGAGDTQVGRIGGQRGSYGPDTVFTPDGASALRNTKREQTLADEAAKIAEEKRKEGVIAGRESTARRESFENEKTMEGIRQTNRTGIETLRDSLARDRDKDKAKKPGVSLTGVDDLRKNVTSSLADRLGQLPTKEGDLNPEEVQTDPGVVGDIMARASELMDDPNNLSAMDAINQAIAEKADLGEDGTGGAGKAGGVDLPLFGLTGAHDVKTIKKKGADPLGIRK